MASSLSTDICCQSKSLQLTNGLPHGSLHVARWKFLGVQLQPAAPGRESSCHRLEEPGVGFSSDGAVRVK